MQSAQCKLCGRTVARQGDGLRQHKTIARPINGKIWAAGHVQRMSLDTWRAINPPYCFGGAQQLVLTGFGS